jgi:hypothetical protein
VADEATLSQQPGSWHRAPTSVDAPDDLPSLYNSWLEAGAPLLPAGNANPPLPNSLPPAPRYSGLAVASVDVTGVQQALAARRGWLTSSPGLWLTLRAERSGESAWMGSLIAAGNDLTLHIHYGDRGGEVAGLALWLDNRPIRLLDSPPPDGRWSVTLPAVPGSFLYAVALQADGDFVVSAPLLVEAGDSGRVLINEVLPSAWADYTGDDDIDVDDEFIELYNPDEQPISLRGWQLADRASDGGVGRRFTFGPGRFVGGRGFLRLWRKETGLSLNNDEDAVFCCAPTAARST